jgi:hypothetical protein
VAGLTAALILWLYGFTLIGAALIYILGPWTLLITGTLIVLTTTTALALNIL